MEPNIYTITNDLSWAGLRRYHIMGGEVVHLRREVAERVRAERGELMIVSGWCDEALENQHIYSAWRYKMLTYPMFVCTIDYDPPKQSKKKRKTPLHRMGEAVALAASKYFHRNGAWPNSVVMHEHDLRKIEGYQAETPVEFPMDLGEGGIIAVAVVPQAINWPRGHVGAFVDPGDVA